MKSGPAITLKITGNIGEEKILLDVDLVVAFIIQQEKWPKGQYRQNLTPKVSYFSFHYFKPPSPPWYPTHL